MGKWVGGWIELTITGLTTLYSMLCVICFRLSTAGSLLPEVTLIRSDVASTQSLKTHSSPSLTNDVKCERVKNGLVNGSAVKLNGQLVNGSALKLNGEIVHAGEKKATRIEGGLVEKQSP